MKIELLKYKLYIIIYFLIFYGILINPDLFPKEILLMYLVIISILEFKFLKANFNKVKFFVLFSLISMISFVLRDSYNNASLGIFFMFYPILLLSYQQKQIGSQIQLILLVIYSSFVLLHVIPGGDANDIFVNRSRNIVSFYCLILVIHYYIEKYRYQKQIPLWPALLSMTISLYCIGRAGILTSALLLSLIVFMKLRKLNFIKTLKYGVLLLITSIISAAYGLQLMVTNFIDLSLFKLRDRGLDDSSRELVVLNYLNDMFDNIFNFILGVPLDNNSVYSELEFNLHNSFLNAHYYFGIFSLVIFFYIFKAFFKKGGDLFYKGLLLVLLIRGLSDKLFFTGFNDVIIFYLIFLISERVDINRVNSQEELQN